jgi:hypothetical protein
MDGKEEKNGIAQRAEEFLQAFRKGAEFTQQLLKENERLRYQLVQQEEKQPGGQDPADVLAELERLRRRVADLEREKAQILERIAQVEAENADFANRYVEIEAENNSLANLYIATYQLHSTLDLPEVLKIVSEIIINLIGGEEFALYLLDENAGRLQAVSAEGFSLEQLPTFRLGEDTPGSVASSGESFYVGQLADFASSFDQPLACIPLKIKERVIGVIAVYKLFTQKTRFADIDYELFTLLAGHAATAIFSSKLYCESERKLSTIQGFLDLLTK